MAVRSLSHISTQEGRQEQAISQLKDTHMPQAEVHKLLLSVLGGTEVTLVSSDGVTFHGSRAWLSRSEVFERMLTSGMMEGQVQ